MPSLPKLNAGDISNLRKGKKIAVGSMTDLTIVRKIGEGGSAFVYTARRSTRGNSGAVGVDTSFASSSASSGPTNTNLNAFLFSDTASLSGMENDNVLNTSAADDDDKASVMSFAIGDYASSLSKSIRRRRGSRSSSRSLLSRMGGARKRSSSPSASAGLAASGTSSAASDQQLVVIKATSTSGSSTRKTQAEKEIEILLRFRNHPNIVHIHDWSTTANTITKSDGLGVKQQSITMCALEYCKGGSLMDLIIERRKRLLADREAKSGNACTGNNAKNSGGFRKRLSFSINGTLDEDDVVPPPPPPPFVGEETTSSFSQAYIDFEDVLSIFQQVSSALSFLHGQNPVIHHRDIKPENVLLVPTSMSDVDVSMLPGMDRWRVKMCDFGSVVEGRVPLRTAAERNAANDVIQKSTTQMYRAPEMVDVHSVEQLSTKTDVWSLGCTLYMTCYLQNCFEENSNLQILSGKFIEPPNDHPYGKTQVHELINRMLTVDVSHRADVVEVCECVEAMTIDKALPERRSPSHKSRARSKAASKPYLPSHKSRARSQAASKTEQSPRKPPLTIDYTPTPTPKKDSKAFDSIPRSVVVDHRAALEGPGHRMESSLPMDANQKNSYVRNRDMRKISNRREKDQANSTKSLNTSAAVDHIYSDLHKQQTSPKAKGSPDIDVQDGRRGSKHAVEQKIWKATTNSDLETIECSYDETALDRTKIYSTNTTPTRSTRGSSHDWSSTGSVPQLTPSSCSSDDHFSSCKESFGSTRRRRQAVDPPARTFYC